MAKKLNKEECNALLELFNGKKSTFESALKNKLKSQDVISMGAKKTLSLSELVPVFQFMYENISKSVQKKLSIEYKTNIYLKTISVDIVKFGDYKASLKKDSLTFIFNAKELYCSMLIHVEDSLSSTLVSKSLGSNNSSSVAIERTHSKIDEMTISKSVFILSKELEAIINSAYEKIKIDFVKIENRAQLLSNFHPDDNVLKTVIEVNSETVNGCFHIIIPGMGVKLLKSQN